VAESLTSPLPLPLGICTPCSRYSYATLAPWQHTEAGGTWKWLVWLEGTGEPIKSGNASNEETAKLSVQLAVALLEIEDLRCSVANLIRLQPRRTVECV
jgi:hypothetical protein